MDMNELQKSILDVCLRLDEICKKHDIPYMIMGGTALGAVRHGGFIPWDDDIDVFMTPDSFEKFRTAVEMENSDEFFIDTVGLSDVYTEYAKFKKKNTTFIEKVYLDKDVRHNVFVDIMLLRKLPNGKFKRKLVYYMSRLVSFLTISETEWQPKTAFHKFAKKISKILPRKKLAGYCLKRLAKYEHLTDFDAYCYFMSKVKFSQGVFEKEIFQSAEYIDFENTKLLAPSGIRKYLEIRYGDYMSMPPEHKRVGEHAFFADTEKDYTEYIDDFKAKYAVLSFRREQSGSVKEIFDSEHVERETGKAYPSGGTVTHIDDTKYPLHAVQIRGNADIGEMVRLFKKMKTGYICTFDIDGLISEKSAKKIVKAIKEYGITTVSSDNLKKKLHGKV